MISKPWIRNSIIVGLLLLILALMLAIKQVLAPVFVALAIAYVGDPLIDWFEKHKISRTLGIVILLTVFALGLVGFGYYLIPRLVTEISSLAQDMPKYWDTFYKRVQPFIEGHEAEVKVWTEKGIAWAEENAGMLASNISAAVLTSFRSIGSFFANMLGLLIIPVLAFYFLRDFDIMTEKAKQLIPIKRRELAISLLTDLHVALSNFIKGQLLVALILSVIYSIGLLIAGCPAAILIGLIAGFANLIPYLGIALGLVPAVLLTYLAPDAQMWQVIFAASTFLVGQMLEGMLITPKVVGESVGLHPVVVMVGIMIGGTYFGLMGMILALPATAVVMVLLRRSFSYYTSSIIYHEDETLLGVAIPTEASTAQASQTQSEPQTPVKPKASATQPKKGARKKRRTK